jgi:hypothetical protein
MTPKTAPKTGVKRKADAESDDEVQVTDAKRIAPEQREADASIQLSTRMHKRFAKYPLTLRTTIEAATKTTFQTYMSSLLAGKLPTHPQPFQIIHGTRVRSQSVSFSREVRHTNILDLNIANVTLMEHFATIMAGTMSRADFVELETVEGLKNEEFIGLHSTRRDEVGWALDCEGGLSLYVAKMKEKKLEEFVWYVEKGSIKLEP